MDRAIAGSNKIGPAMPTPHPEWQKTACILCSLNCGIEVQVGGADGRHLVKIKGDKAHPISRGYLCEKAQRLDFYQTGGDRLDTRRCGARRRQLRGDRLGHGDPRDRREVHGRSRRATAATRSSTTAAADRGTTSAAPTATATLAAIGNRYRSNALAQEKTGEFWVNGKMIGAGTHGDFEHCEVAVFIGKNPWQSHGFARARVAHPRDRRRTRSARSSSSIRAGARPPRWPTIHLAIKPGTDAWCLAALVAIIVQEDLVRDDWVAEHTAGFEDDRADSSARSTCAKYAAACGIDEDLLRRVARRIARRRERLGARGPRHADVRALDARQLRPAAHLAAHRELRPQGHQLRAAVVRRR